MNNNYNEISICVNAPERIKGKNERDHSLILRVLLFKEEK